DLSYMMIRFTAGSVAFFSDVTHAALVPIGSFEKLPAPPVSVLLPLFPLPEPLPKTEPSLPHAPSAVAPRAPRARQREIESAERAERACVMTLKPFPAE